MADKPSPEQTTFGFLGDVEKLAPLMLREPLTVPPFTVLDARQGYWQERKQAWLALGIKSELGRAESMTWSIDPNGISTRFRDRASTDRGKALLEKKHEMAEDDEEEIDALSSGTSIFDPVLCELAYSWFCPPNAFILDPFAGGSVRGIVAAYLGHRYVGIDLSERQIEANKVQGEEIVPANPPRWVVGDAMDVAELLPNLYFDFIFTCPPYYNLEVYSDDPRDLSTFGSYSRFQKSYTEIIERSCRRLKHDRFACFVVGDIRDEFGFYRDFPGDTIAAFQDMGMKLYNQAILVTAVASLSIRIGGIFGAARKLGKTHQNVLIFYKGDPKHIKQIFVKPGEDRPR